MNRLHVSPVENIFTKEPLKRMSLRFAQDDGFVGDGWRVLAACKSGTAEGRTAGPSASPDFLSALLASAVAYVGSRKDRQSHSLSGQALRLHTIAIALPSRCACGERRNSSPIFSEPGLPPLSRTAMPINICPPATLNARNQDLYRRANPIRQTPTAPEGRTVSNCLG